MNFLRWLHYRLMEPGRPWHNADLRCRQWHHGPFNTDWQCLLIWDHEEVEQLPHIYEPELWPGGRWHEEWMGRGNPFLKEEQRDQAGEVTAGQG